eukprot:TRINITY_DN31140_c0_g1_i1.p1 TRINITY_DN31140_c0_g1~~TRINITY_DN31140_c0_g1_i1.p1  ORF type:complete len:796 (+),score=114.36 TRINITY_DN31140_c0_g1_i1:82-2469(+)
MPDGPRPNSQSIQKPLGDVPRGPRLTNQSIRKSSGDSGDVDCRMIASGSGMSGTRKMRESPEGLHGKLRKYSPLQTTSRSQRFSCPSEAEVQKLLDASSPMWSLWDLGVGLLLPSDEARSPEDSAHTADTALQQYQQQDTPSCSSKESRLKTSCSSAATDADKHQPCSSQKAPGAGAKERQRSPNRGTRSPCTSPVVPSRQIRHVRDIANTSPCASPTMSSRQVRSARACTPSTASSRQIRSARDAAGTGSRQTKKSLADVAAVQTDSAKVLTESRSTGAPAFVTRLSSPSGQKTPRSPGTSREAVSANRNQLSPQQRSRLVKSLPGNAITDSAKKPQHQKKLLGSDGHRTCSPQGSRPGPLLLDRSPLASAARQSPQLRRSPSGDADEKVTTACGWSRLQGSSGRLEAARVSHALTASQDTMQAEAEDEIAALDLDRRMPPSAQNTCYICGARHVNSESLEAHTQVCRQLFALRQAQRPPQERRPLLEEQQLPLGANCLQQYYYAPQKDSPYSSCKSLAPQNSASDEKLHQRLSGYAASLGVQQPQASQLPTQVQCPPEVQFPTASPLSPKKGKSPSRGKTSPRLSLELKAQNSSEGDLQGSSTLIARGLLLQALASQEEQLRAEFASALPTSEVVNVFRVAHAESNMYSAMLSTMQRKDPAQLPPFELELWHGTSWACVSKILRHGFNRSFAGRHGTLLGVATYFSNDLAYSQRFCDRRSAGRATTQVVLLARVLVGKYCKGWNKCIEPPVRDVASGARYDSTVDDVDNPKIFAVFRDFQAIPLFLVEFRPKA